MYDSRNPFYENSSTGAKAFPVNRQGAAAVDRNRVICRECDRYSIAHD
jgi:hypothetical protein